MPGHWILTWPEVAVLDANAAACGIELCDLMQAAGIAVANEVCTIISLSKHIDHVLILCGPGNNGGDGFVVAQELSERGIPVTIIASHDSQSTSLSEQQRLLCFKHEIQIFTWPEKPSFSGPTLVVDALVGVGASGPGSPPRGNIAQILDWAACNPSLTEIVACDLPTVLGHTSSL